MVISVLYLLGSVNSLFIQWIVKCFDSFVGNFLDNLVTLTAFPIAKSCFLFYETISCDVIYIRFEQKIYDWFVKFMVCWHDWFLVSFIFHMWNAWYADILAINSNLITRAVNHAKCIRVFNSCDKTVMRSEGLIIINSSTTNCLSESSCSSFHALVRYRSRVPSAILRCCGQRSGIWWNATRCLLGLSTTRYF